MEATEPEPVHALRVTTRRLQELLDLAPEVLAKSPHGNTIRALRQARKSCDAVRNLDVLASLIAPRAKGKGGQHDLWQPLADSLGTAREREQARLRRAIERIGLAAIHGRWDDALKRWPKADPKAEQRIREHLIDHLVKRHTQFIRAREAATAKGASTRDSHGLRLAGKRLRYALEALADLGDAAAKQSLTRLRAFQATLGEWHDYEMLAELIIEHISRRKFLRRSPKDALELLKHLAKCREIQAKKLTRALQLSREIESVDDVLGDALLHPAAEGMKAG
jgi:CHAD domain-containing protein